MGCSLVPGVLSAHESFCITVVSLYEGVLLSVGCVPHVQLLQVLNA